MNPNKILFGEIKLECITMNDIISDEVSNLAHQLVCMRNISRLFSQSVELNKTLETLVYLIPEGWQYPSDASVRISLENYVVQPENFIETSWALTAPIRTSNGVIGRIGVFYLDEKPPAHEGPFLEIERILIDTIAVELGSFIEHAQIERARKQQHMELELYSSLLRHDLRNDLSIILSNIDGIELLLSDRSEMLEELLLSSEAVCERMLKLLTIFGKSSKTVESQITKLIRIATAQAQEANSELTIKIFVSPEDEGLKVPESKLLPFVFDNIFRNTITHAGDRPTVEIEISRCDNKVQIIMSDDGPGIAEEIKDRLFTRGASTREGGGLGLYLSKNVIESMEGTINLIESKNGAGATFRILLPLEY